ncbi:MAG: polyprenol monophosphomannose synthase [Planctomycetota bacterium]
MGGVGMAKAGHGRTLVAVATYNEKENIAALLLAIFESLPDAEILVVDDASPDGTGKIVEEMRKDKPRIHVIHRSGKLGLGTAILEAMRFAIAKDFAYIFTMDADFSHPPIRLRDIQAGMDSHDVMIGSRYIPGGSISGWNWTRLFMSRGINLYSRFLLRLPVKDCSGGFRGYRVAKLRQIDFEQVRSKGYSFMEEFLFHCKRVGCRFGETPIHFENRKHGDSKLDLREAVVALWSLLILALRG